MFSFPIDFNLLLNISCIIDCRRSLAVVTHLGHYKHARIEMFVFENTKEKSIATNFLVMVQKINKFSAIVRESGLEEEPEKTWSPIRTRIKNWHFALFSMFLDFFQTFPKKSIDPNWSFFNVLKQSCAKRRCAHISRFPTWYKHRVFQGCFAIPQLEKIMADTNKVFIER